MSAPVDVRPAGRSVRPPVARPAVPAAGSTTLAERTLGRLTLAGPGELPAWPVLWLLWGGPIWWAIGLSPFATILAAIPMVAYLVRRGRVALPPGVLPLIVLVLWTIPCALMLDSSGRLIGFALEFAQLASVAVILVYVVNARSSLSVPALLSALTFTWVFVIVGGYLGLLWPDTVLTNTVGRLLPGSLRGNEYISDLLFPPFAEVQLPYGAEQPFLRPSAPFTYTNGWGAAIAILTPVAVATALQRGTARSILLLFVGLVAAVPPAIATSNRGLFLGLGVATVYVLVRLVFRRRWRPFLFVTILGGATAAALAALGLLDAIAQRQDAADTTAGRGDLYAETFARTLTSPILGFGSPRPSYTSEISVGTQGMVWTYMFSFGFAGLALLAIFLLGSVARTWRAPGMSALWLHASLVTACALSVFYGLDRHLVSICIVAGILLREKYAPASDYWRPGQR